MAGKGCWGAGPPRRRATRQGGELAPSGPGGSPPPGLGAPAGAQVPAVRALRWGRGGRRSSPRARRGTRCGWRGPAGRKLPRSRPSASRGTERFGDALPAGLGARDLGRKSPQGPSGGGGDALNQGARGCQSPARAPAPSPSAPHTAAPARGGGERGRGKRGGGESHDPSDFANRAQPVDGKVRAAAAGRYSLSPLVGQKASAAARSRSAHSEARDPPPRGDFIPAA